MSWAGWGRGTTSFQRVKVDTDESNASLADCRVDHKSKHGMLYSARPCIEATVTFTGALIDVEKLTVTVVL